MTEEDVIQRTYRPYTREQLAEELSNLGIRVGDTIMVHTSLSSLGYVVGGANTVVEALMEALTPEGTLVMPTQSPYWSDPVHWDHPPVPTTWWSLLREGMPGYDTRTTPTAGMGQVPERFRTYPGVIRSDHPKNSFAAWGKEAKPIIQDHPLCNSLGEESPLARLYDKDAQVLFIGTGYATNTCFHLAEYRVPGGVEIEEGAAVNEAGKRVWKTYRDIDHETEWFEAIGIAFEQQQNVRMGRVGQAECRLFSLREAVDFATEWLTQKRS